MREITVTLPLHSLLWLASSGIKNGQAGAVATVLEAMEQAEKTGRYPNPPFPAPGPCPAPHSQITLAEQESIKELLGVSYYHEVVGEIKALIQARTERDDYLLRVVAALGFTGPTSDVVPRIERLAQDEKDMRLALDSLKSLVDGHGMSISGLVARIRFLKNNADKLDKVKECFDKFRNGDYALGEFTDFMTAIFSGEKNGN